MACHRLTLRLQGDIEREKVWTWVTGVKDEMLGLHGFTIG